MVETTTAVNIHMISRINREGAQVDQTDKELEGELIEKGTSYYLSYQENDPELGMSQHVLKLGTDQGVIIRRGAVSMRLPFILGEETSGEYQSPYGPFSMRALTDFFKMNWSGRSGDIHLRYNLELQGEPVGRFSLEFHLKAK
jgi:uncharacterized beta-barrel protein YwiB (DUF1934 family)